MDLQGKTQSSLSKTGEGNYMCLGKHPLKLSLKVTKKHVV